MAMSADTNKKSARTFQCREALWDAFEQMARELECSVDYLINEAMKQYVRQRSYGAQRTPYPVPARPPDSPTERAPAPPAFPVTAPSAPASTRQPALGAALPVPPLPVPPALRSTGPLAPPPAVAALPVRTPLPMPPPPARSSGLAAMPSAARHLPPSSRTVPPPLPRGSTNGSPAPAGTALSIVYQGERVAVSKDRFIIGRGKQASDLTLKDPNVSRQHAMIELQNGVHFMVDMGSTNGVEFNGQRIARKQIAEGDVFRICDHEIAFTYR